MVRRRVAPSRTMWPDCLKIEVGARSARRCPSFETRTMCAPQDEVVTDEAMTLGTKSEPHGEGAWRRLEPWEQQPMRPDQPTPRRHHVRSESRFPLPSKTLYGAARDFALGKCRLTLFIKGLAVSLRLWRAV